MTVGRDRDGEASGATGELQDWSADPAGELAVDAARENMGAAGLRLDDATYEELTAAG